MCGSHEVQISTVNEVKLKNQHHSVFWWLFIDWWWVGHTKAWIIPGTEDLRPYIHGRTLVFKWVGTLVAFPAFFAVLSWLIVSLFSM